MSQEVQFLVFVIKKPFKKDDVQQKINLQDLGLLITIAIVESV
jgi:hypothetical protein